MPALEQIASFLDSILNTGSIPDYPNAVNGVQFANVGNIERVACAVDFSSETIAGAIDAGARLLIVHHGMFWGGIQPFTAHRHRRLRDLITNDIAVYSSHLPLDVHPELGNNALLAKRLGLTPTAGFAKYHSIDVGVSGSSDVPTRVLAERASELASLFRGHLISTPFADDRVTRRWGICTGSGADSSTLREAALRGLDTLIVGEGPHHTSVEARELGIVVLYAGHYATETLGVCALGERLSVEFGLESAFVDAPSGL